jgi:hypothetical protein
MSKADWMDEKGWDLTMDRWNPFPGFPENLSDADRLFPVTMLGATDREYEYFILPFLASSLWRFKEAKAEVIVSRPAKDVIKENRAGFAALTDHFGTRWTVTTVEERFAKANFSMAFVRYVQQPRLHSTFTYAGDIDIVYVLPGICVHVYFTEATGLNYSNLQRLKKGADGEPTFLPKLSGMHFCKTDEHYGSIAPALQKLLDRPRPKIPYGRQGGPDEEALYRICAESMPVLPDGEDMRFRPILGMHLSPGRAPMGRPVGKGHKGRAEPGWVLTENDIPTRYEMLAGTVMWKELREHFDPRFSSMLTTAEGIMRESK